ncbi:MAG: molecular chaperone TorD family protein [Rhodothermia bacterium]|nr:molecular chaperone TorD family protein [Rhodothermia bacterium]
MTVPCPGLFWASTEATQAARLMDETRDHLIGRVLAYRLFGDFFRHGLTTELRSRLDVVDDLQKVLPSSVDSDEWGARHYEVLGMNVVPQAGWYLDKTGMLGGISSGPEHLQSLLMGNGTSSESADHISNELAVVEHLLRFEIDGDDTTPEQRRLLDDHLLWWLFPFCFAIGRFGDDFYGEVAALLVDVVIDHRADLGTGLPSEVPMAGQADVLADGKAGIKEIAQHLTVVSQSGIVLTRRRIEDMARSAEVPRGFGDRAQMLSNLLRSAGQYDRVEQTLASIADECKTWKGLYQGVRRLNVNALDQIAAEWTDRIDNTLAMIDRISGELGSLK